MRRWRGEKKVTSLDELVDAMCSDQHNLSTELVWWKNKDAYIYRTLTHGYSASSDVIEVTPVSLCEQAKAAGYIQGRPEWGYTSDTHWLITHEGKRRAWAIRDTAKLVEKPIKVNYDQDGEG